MLRQQRAERGRLLDNGRHCSRNQLLTDEQYFTDLQRRLLQSRATSVDEAMNETNTSEQAAAFCCVLRTAGA